MKIDRMIKSSEYKKILEEYIDNLVTKGLHAQHLTEKEFSKEV